MLGQLSNRESLWDLIIALDAHHSKCYHLGIGRNVSRSSLARANQDRDYHIFEEYAYYLINDARQKQATEIFKLGGNIYAFDSTTIDLCLAVFWWAKFPEKKGGIKIHTLKMRKHKYLPSFISPNWQSTIQWKWMKQIVNLTLTTSLTMPKTILRFSKVHQI